MLIILSLSVGPDDAETAYAFPCRDTYEGTLRSRLDASVLQVDLDSSLQGQALFVVEDCELDRSGDYAGLLVRPFVLPDSCCKCCCMHAYSDGHSCCCMQLQSFVHVYCAELEFADSLHCLFLCDCAGMTNAWELLSGMETSAMSVASCCQSLKFCCHSKAINALHQTGVIPYASTLPGAQRCSRLDKVEFCCSKQPVCVVRSTPSLILSTDFGNGSPCDGMTRALIRADKKKQYVCSSCSGPAAYTCSDHIEPFKNWLDAHDTNNALAGEVFEPYSFKADQRGSPGTEDGYDGSFQSISSRPISLDTCNEAMRQRAFCGE